MAPPSKGTRMLDTLILPLLLLAAGQAQPGGAPPAEPPRTGVGRGADIFVSPMGEPFRNGAEREDLGGRWLVGADADGDGALGLAEMEKDAARFFAALDTNGDGEIDPAEIEHYESRIAPEIRRLSYMSPSVRRGGGGSRPGLRRGPGARPISLLGLPQPVTAADTDFNRGVSREEFRKAAGQRFVLLDTDRNGRLEPAELVPFRPRGSAPAAAEAMKIDD